MVRKYRSKGFPELQRAKDDPLATAAAGDESHVAAALAQRMEAYIDERVEVAMERMSDKVRLKTEGSRDFITGLMICGLILAGLGALVAGSNGFLASLGIIALVNVVWLWRPPELRIGNVIGLRLRKKVS